MDAQLKEKTLDYLENICSKREYCRQDIFRKALQRLEGDREAASELLDELAGNKFVSDLRYACAFAREKSAITGWGPVKIEFALKAKGIDSGIIKEALQEIEPQKSDDRLRRLLESKWRSLEGDPYSKFKLIKFALSRGYNYEQIKDMVEEIAA